MISINIPRFFSRPQQQQLPDEIFGEILSYLPFDDVQTFINCSLVNKKFNEITSSDVLWKNIYLNKYNTLIYRRNDKIKKLYAEKNRECNEKIVARTQEYFNEKLDYFTPESWMHPDSSRIQIQEVGRNFPDLGAKKNFINLERKGQTCLLECFVCYTVVFALSLMSFLVTSGAYAVFGHRDVKSIPSNQTLSNYTMSNFTSSSNYTKGDIDKYMMAGLGLAATNVLLGIAFCCVSIFIKYVYCWKGGARSSELTAKTLFEAHRTKIKNNCPSRCTIL